MHITSLFPVPGLALLLGVPPSPWPPWIEPGHQIIALLAWPELTDVAREKVTELLRQHPRYREDLLAGLPADSDAAAAARYAFALAAAWPDTVRNISNPMHHAGDHPTWHYIDIPFAIEGVPVPEKPAPKEPGPRDAVEALGTCLADLGNGSLDLPARAIALCWVAHLTADLHQPLHACTLYSPQFPQGDRGGNAFLVLRDAKYADSRMNLHLVWDSLLGTYRSHALDACVAAGLAQQPQLARARFGAALDVHDPAAWARESHELAVEHVYLRGRLEGAVAAGNDPPKIPPLPNGYVAEAEVLAMRQAALAAHRLADALNRTFAPR